MVRPLIVRLVPAVLAGLFLAASDAGHAGCRVSCADMPPTLR
jgi:hypothetical protein